MAPNRLIHEKSPYLLQHAHNPVDWRPWGPEAFEEARASNRPVFLSIGYSTCHWCHVMERESFEDAEVAALLNARYVPVKVDREERPDVDQVYMRACQALTGRGGWPLTLLLDGEGRPFYAATYLPKRSRGGQPGLVDLLGRISEFWRERPEEVARAAAGIVEALGTELRGEGAAGGVPGPAVFAAAVEQLAARFDERNGGFGPPPKFPAPHQLSFLLARCRRTGDARALTMACATLDAMRAGGLWDQLGGGFHRYSTDERWLVPHFEKMLYDQAGLAVAYAEAFQITGLARHAATARATLGYVLRDLSDPGGGFHCGEDADSEGEEGRFYLWTTGEVERILGESSGAAFAARYGMTGGGNYRDEATGEATGRNILHIPWPSGGGIDWEAEDRWAPARTTLLEHRSRRVRPLRDDKVLAGWTGFAASAFARVGAALAEPVLAERARRALDFVDGVLGGGGSLLRRYRDGEAAVAAFAEDYAFLARGRLDLYGAAFDRADLGRAVTLAEELWERFASEDGAIHETAHDAEPLVWRPREATDGALPAPGSVAVEVFARLHLLTGEAKWAERAEKTAGADGALVSGHPTAFCRLLQGAALLTEPTRIVTVTGPGHDPEARRLLDAALGAYAPETAVLAAEEGEVAEARVCEGTACLPPVRSSEELKGVLSRAP